MRLSRRKADLNLYRLVSQKIFPVGLTKRACRFWRNWRNHYLLSTMTGMLISSICWRPTTVWLRLVKRTSAPPLCRRASRASAPEIASCVSSAPKTRPSPKCSGRLGWRTNRDPGWGILISTQSSTPAGAGIYWGWRVPHSHAACSNYGWNGWTAGRHPCDPTWYPAWAYPCFLNGTAL